MRIRHVLALAGILAAAPFVSVQAVGADDDDDAPARPSVPRFTVTTVRVVDAKTVDTTFSNPLDRKVTDVSARVFHAPHWDWDVPHSHEAVSVTLRGDGRTARVILDRGLHPEEPLCDTPEPRCSDDELDWTTRRAPTSTGRRSPTTTGRSGRSAASDERMA